MLTLNELKKKSQVVWIAAKPIITKVLTNEVVLWLLFCTVISVVFGGIGWLWDQTEWFKWIVIGLGAVVLLLIGFGLVAALWPLLLGLAALVYLFKNC